jgi:hypothetical protein
MSSDISSPLLSEVEVGSQSMDHSPGTVLFLQPNIFHNPYCPYVPCLQPYMAQLYPSHRFIWPICITPTTLYGLQQPYMAWIYYMACSVPLPQPYKYTVNIVYCPYQYIAHMYPSHKRIWPTCIPTLALCVSYVFSNRRVWPTYGMARIGVPLPQPYVPIRPTCISPKAPYSIAQYVPQQDIAHVYPSFSPILPTYTPPSYLRIAYSFPAHNNIRPTFTPPTYMTHSPL